MYLYQLKYMLKIVDENRDIVDDNNVLQNKTPIYVYWWISSVFQGRHMSIMTS